MNHDSNERDRAAIDRFLDGTADAADLRRVERAIDDPRRAAELRALVRLEGELLAGGRTGGGSATADAALTRIEDDRSARIADAVVRSLADEPTPARPAKLGRRAALAAGISTALAWAWAVFVRPAADPAVGPGEEGFETGALPRLVGDGGERPLRDGEWVDVAEADRSIELRYADGTSVLAFGPARLCARTAEGGGKELAVPHGLFSADVAPQAAERPLRVVTPAATLSVLGTTLDVAAAADRTRLDVGAGRVAITRTADGRRAEVGAGQFATASTKGTTAGADAELRPAPQPAVPDAWAMSLSGGLPPGWIAGELLPTPDGPAVRSRSDGKGRERNVAVTTYNAWGAGEVALARLHGDSLLTLRLRQDEPAPLRVMLATRALPGADARFGRQLYYDLPAEPAESFDGGWRTLRVPLGVPDRHRRRGRFERSPIAVTGLAPYIVQVTAGERDVGLVVRTMLLNRFAAAAPLVEPAAGVSA